MAPLTPLLLAASLASAGTVKVLTFNAAGIPLVHPRLGARVKGAGAAIAAGGFDIAGLQELWRDGDSDALAAASGLPHAVRFRRRLAFRTGLTILSRWPAVRAEERAFSAVRPSLRHLLEGEAVAGKGFLFARVAAPGGELDVYAAHTLADYPEARYRLLRMTELFELAEGIRELSADRPFVVLGDLNSGRGDPEYGLFLDLLGLEDPCAPKGTELCADPRRPKRIDHVLLPGPAAKARRVLGEELSDHSGFAAELPASWARMRAKPDPKRREAALRAIEETISEGIKRLESERCGMGIPIYGAFLRARYSLQTDRLKAILERAASRRFTGSR